MALTEVRVKSFKPAATLYRVADGKGLCLEVTPSGSKLWRYRYRFADRASMLSLGAYPEVSLAKARELCDTARALVRVGVNPATERQATKTRAVTAAANTFGAVALEWFGKQAARMSDATKKKARMHLSLPDPVKRTNKTRRAPLIPAAFSLRPIKDIAAPDVLAVLRPIEETGHMETAHRVQQRISQVFRYAIATGRVTRDPVPDLRNALAPVVRTPRAAITNPQDISRLLLALDTYTGKPATRAALKLAPLLFVRPAELRSMEWSEIDWNAAEWRIPAAKMKMRDTHTVPLSDQALAILQGHKEVTGAGRYAFPGAWSGEKPMSDAAVNNALRRLGFDNVTHTGHGFRAMASTRLNEMGWSPDIIERQLAHVERNQVRAAYNRATYMQERHEMMQQWANYLDGLKADPDKVVSINRRKRTAA